MLTFIFAVTIPAPASAVPARLAGWAIAVAAGIGAQMLLWPSRPDAKLRGEAARACVALADLAGAELGPDRQPAVDRVQAAGEAVSALRRQFLAAPHTPSGPIGPQAALGSLVDELDWLLSLLVSPGQVPGLDACAQEYGDAVAALVAALRAVAVTLAGGDGQPDLGRLDRTRGARGAVGLGAAVYIAQRAGGQHGFWVVLGTLSVLRSNALGTGRSIVRVLAGTAAGIVLGAALIIAIGTDEAVLWAVLPVAVLVASYAPRVILLIPGQVGFAVPGQAARHPGPAAVPQAAQWYRPDRKQAG